MVEISYSKDALKTLRRMPAKMSKLIRAKIEQYADAPSSLANNVTEMKGYEDVRRLRVGDWRVIFSASKEIIAVIKIAPRGGVYD